MMKSVLLPYGGVWPKIDESVFLAPGSVVVGDVEIGSDSGVWYNVTIRGDVHVVRIGSQTNIQEGVVIHETHGGQGTHIGDRITVGHKALLHDCTLEDDSFVGMGAIVLDGAKVESHGMLAAGAMLTYGKVVPSGELWAGSPAKFMRRVKDEELSHFEWSYRHYSRLAKEHKEACGEG
jgi:carbonic anhydrase/acetyltransferase-like protein (isoleucine patch superfamily)